mmetsp:Transcript_1730/g.2820  ORF Transcript_1730/g.2820 Transcript_1730/m.2820 type:complete len:98 (+) Transcript_1730:196-489(+)
MDTNTNEQQEQVDYNANAPNTVLLFEDKEHYPANVYPEQVNTVTLTEDTDRFLDTPGHMQFTDEVTCSTALSDGVLLVVEPLEPIINLPHILPKFFG